MNGRSLTHERNNAAVALTHACLDVNAPGCFCELRHALAMAVDKAMLEIKRRRSVQDRDAVALP